MNFVFSDRLALRIVGLTSLADKVINNGDSIYIVSKDVDAVRESGRIDFNRVSAVESYSLVPDDKRRVVEYHDKNYEQGENATIVDVCKRFLPLEDRMDVDKMTYFILGERGNSRKVVEANMVSRMPLVMEGALSDGSKFCISYFKGVLSLKIIDGGYSEEFTRVHRVATYCDNLENSICCGHAFREFSHILSYSSGCKKTGLFYCGLYK